MDFDSSRRGSIKSKMLQSFLSSGPVSSSSSTRSTSSKCSYKSSKQVVTSKGSKIAVFESQSESFVASETVGDETQTESSHAEAERYCELEKDEQAIGYTNDTESIMGAEFGAIMAKPFGSLLPEFEDDEAFESDEALDSATDKRDLECKFGICPEGSRCTCLDDCEINEEESCHLEEETQIVSTMNDIKLNN